MADSAKTYRWRLPPLAASALALALTSTVAIPVRAVAEETKPACSRISHTLFVGDEPVQVNPGAKCRMRLSIEVMYEGQETCIYVRQAGRNNELGPFCTSTAAVKPLPTGIESIWSADRPLRVRVFLTPN